MTDQHAEPIDSDPTTVRPAEGGVAVDPREASREAFFVGVRATRAALSAWRRDPREILLSWAGGSALAAAVLLVGVLVVAELTHGPGPADVTGPPFQPGDLGNVVNIFADNLLVLAMHVLGCLAGFTAGSSLPIQARSMRGARRFVAIQGARFSLLFVTIAMVGSLFVQILTIGHDAGWIATRLQTSPTKVLLGVLPHAAVELFAMFLPLAALLRAARRDEPEQLLAAAAVTAAIAAPILLACACWETWVAPHIVSAIVGPI